MPQPSIAVVGSINTDIIVRSERLPAAGAQPSMPTRDEIARLLSSKMPQGG